MNRSELTAAAERESVLRGDKAMLQGKVDNLNRTLAKLCSDLSRSSQLVQAWVLVDRLYLIFASRQDQCTPSVGNVEKQEKPERS